MLNVDQILSDWEQFLYDALGAPRGIDALSAIIQASAGGSLDQLIERFPAIKAMMADPASKQMMEATRNQLATITDEELLALQAPMNKYYGFFLSVDNLVVFMRELLPYLEEVKTVVDVGCGPCSYTSFLIARDILRARVKAVDPSPEMLLRAAEVMAHEKIGGQIELLEGWGHNLPVEDGFADLSLIVDSLHWMSRWRETLRDTARVTREGGRMFICYSTLCPRRSIPVIEAVEVLTKCGMDIEEVNHFDGEASATPRALIVAAKRKPKGIIVPGKVTY